MKWVSAARCPVTHSTTDASLLQYSAQLQISGGKKSFSTLKQSWVPWTPAYRQWYNFQSNFDPNFHISWPTGVKLSTTGILRLPWLRFFRAFSSVVRQMPGYTSQRRVMARTLPNLWIVLFYVLFVTIVLFYVMFVCKCVLYYCHRV
jgi:hypothetical protein